MNKLSALAIILVSVSFLIVSCSKDDSPVSIQDGTKMNVISFSPQEVFPDTVVIVKYINKTGLDAKPRFFVGNVEVNSNKSDINSDTTTSTLSITSSVRSGRIKVMIDRYIDSTTNLLIILNAYRPVICDFNPKSGPPQSEITIKGHNFLSNGSNLEVLLGSEKLDISGISNDNQYEYIKVKAPINVVTGLIKVTNLNGSDISVDKFSVVELNKIIIYDFEPKRGDADTLVTIKALLPDTIISHYSVWFGSLKSNIETITKSGGMAIVVVRAPMGVTTSKIKITSGPDSAVTDAVFFVQGRGPNYELNKPRLRNFSPISGGYNSEITLYGSDFGKAPGDTRVFLGNIECPVKTLSNYEIKITLPLEARSGHFSVINKAGADTATEMFQYFLITKAQLIIQSLKYQGYHVYKNPGNGDSSYYDTTYALSGSALNMKSNDLNTELTYGYFYDSGVHWRYTKTDSVMFKVSFDNSLKSVKNVMFYYAQDYREQPGHNYKYHNFKDIISLNNIPLTNSNDISWTFEVSGEDIKDHIETFSLLKFYGEIHYLRLTYDEYKFVKLNPMDNSSFIRLILYR